MNKSMKVFIVLLLLLTVGLMIYDRVYYPWPL